MAKVLIVEDEKAIVDIIAFNLKREGYEGHCGHHCLQPETGRL